jgi:hypothetical protein
MYFRGRVLHLLVQPLTLGISQKCLREAPHNTSEPILFYWKNRHASFTIKAYDCSGSARKIFSFF